MFHKKVGFGSSLYVFLFDFVKLGGFFVSVFFGVVICFVLRMFHKKIGFGSSLYVFLFEFAKLVGYILPFIITGYQPSIFLLPAALVVASIVLMVGLFLVNRKKQLNFV